MQPPDYLIKIANLREPSREVDAFFVEEPGKKENCGERRILSNDLKISLCSPCFAAQLKLLGEKEKAKRERASAKRIATYKQQGFRYYAAIWIHLHGDDFFVEEPFKKRPAKSEILAVARREKSAVLGDFQVHKIE